MARVSLPGLWTLVSQGCNNFLLPASSRLACCKFTVDGYFVGLIRPDMLSFLMNYPNVFVHFVDPSSGEKQVSLHSRLKTFDQRTATVRAVMLELRETGLIPTLHGWRNEDYGVYINERSKTLFSIERAASSILGITHYGCHVNGYYVQSTLDRSSDETLPCDALQPSSMKGLTRKRKLEHMDPAHIMMWLGVRSSTKPTWPGMMDNMAAGGLPIDMDVLECARKECQEEAGIPENLLAALKPVSRLSYIVEDSRGVCPQVEYCFDLELSSDFVPLAMDGEVASFQLVSIPEVIELITSDRFKPNSAMVVLDFLYRHKLIDEESDPKHEEIKSLMHLKFDFD